VQEISPRFGGGTFDGFVIFDPKPVFALAETLFPGRGAELGNAWRVRQFEYTWLRTLSGRYADFWQVTGEALAFAAKLLKLELTAEKRDRLLQAYLEMKAHPDVRPALETLRGQGVRLGFLSNMTETMLLAATRSAGLDGMFEQVLSTDRVQAYKPDPRAYRMGMDAFGLRREQIVFAAFGGWDAAGAKSFGYPTFWANRLKLPVEELGVAPDAIGGELGALLNFLGRA
jgi:2-haloacid dehalogenase